MLHNNMSTIILLLYIYPHYNLTTFYSKRVIKHGTLFIIKFITSLVLHMKLRNIASIRPVLAFSKE